MKTNADGVILLRLCLIFKNYERDGMNVNQLSKGLNSTYVYQTLRKFKELGLVKMVRVSRDNEVYLTPKGKQIQHHVLGINSITGELEKE